MTLITRPRNGVCVSSNRGSFKNSDMSLSSCVLSSRVCLSLKIDRPGFNIQCNNIMSRRCISSLDSKNTELFGKQLKRNEINRCLGSSYPSRTILRTNLGRRKSSAVNALWMSSSDIASGAFTLGTAAVLPIYTIMIVAPKAEFTKKVVASSVPFVVLGVLYAYLLYLSWTPDTMHLMFASEYWLPELSGIGKMFSSEMTLASAWIHLLAVDLFAARQVYHDGLEENIETRHSVSLCLLFCPVGIVAHFITKALTRHGRQAEQEESTDKAALLSDTLKD